MNSFQRLALFVRGILFSTASLAVVALLALTATSADALIRSPAVGLRSVAITGVGPTGGGGGATPPTLVQPYNVRTTARKLCVGAVAAPCLVSDGTSAVTIGWYDISTDDVRTRLERRLEPDGPWMLRQTIEGPITYAHNTVDRDLAPDSRYCYRLTAEGSTGETRTSSTTCVVTQQARDLPVTRAQLRVIVANVSGAGTDGMVTVGLTEPPGNLPTGNFTAINTPRDDLEAGTDVLYELNVAGVESLRDITRIALGSQSTDTFCVAQLQLVLNANENNGATPDRGIVVYDQYYGTTANRCRWVGGSHGALVVGHAELRATPAFAAFDGGVDLVSIGKEEIEARLEPIIGTLFWERSDIAWDSDESSAVRVTAEGESLRVHLDLEGIAEGPNPEVDIDFLVTPRFLSTASPKIWNFVLDTHDLTTDVDFSWWVEVLSGLLDPICTPAILVADGDHPIADCVSHLEDYIEKTIEASFDAPEESMAVTLPAGCIEPTVSVYADASIRFGCAAFERPVSRFDRATRFLGSAVLLR